jgi:hypothetical protein
MKNNFIILSLVSLSLTVASASAAHINGSNDAYQLPTYRVDAPRYTDAEKAIKKSLDAVRATAGTEKLETNVHQPVATSDEPATTQNVAGEAPAPDGSHRS